MKTRFLILIQFIAINLLFSCGGGSSENQNSESDTLINDTTTMKNETPSTIYEANFTSESGRFKCYFPTGTKPRETSDKVKAEYGDLTVYSFIYESQDIIFTVMYSDYSDKVLKRYTPRQMMTNVEMTFFDKVGLKVAMQDTTKMIEGYPAQIIMGNKGTPGMSDYLYVYRQDMMVKNRLYQLFLVRPDHYPNPEDYEKFIYTFKLILE